MNLYKLHNVGRKNIQLSPNDNIIRKKYSVAYLKELANKYEMREFLSYNYCCYGEDCSCWIDVEGINYGWLWLNNEPEEMSKLLFDMALTTIKSHRDILYKRKMFVVENNDKIIIYFFLRDVIKRDYILTFIKNT